MLLGAERPQIADPVTKCWDDSSVRHRKESTPTRTRCRQEGNKLDTERGLQNDGLDPFEVSIPSRMAVQRSSVRKW